MTATGDGDFLASQPKVHDDCRLIQMAVRKRWPISDEVKAKLVDRLLKVAEGNADDETAIKAINVLKGMEQQNQSDEHKVVDVRIQQRNAELDAIAADLGIDASLIAHAEGTSGASNRITEASEASKRA